MHDHLRAMLATTLREAGDNKVIDVQDPEKKADLIFALVEGSYWCLCMVSSKTEYESRMEMYQATALNILNIN